MRLTDGRDQHLQLQTEPSRGSLCSSALPSGWFVKMLRIASNVVPKLVQRNFRNSLMLPLSAAGTKNERVFRIHEEPPPPSFARQTLRCVVSAAEAGLRLGWCFEFPVMFCVLDLLPRLLLLCRRGGYGRDINPTYRIRQTVFTECDAWPGKCRGRGTRRGQAALGS